MLASSQTNQYQLYYSLEWPLPLGVMELNIFNHPWLPSGKLCFPLSH